MRPTLLVCSGLPASGKTHLGSRLAQSLSWSFVSKDDYKEILHNHLPDLTRTQAGPLSFEIMYHVAGVILAAGANMVLETHFYRTISEPKILALVQRSGANLLQVFCEAPLEVLKKRHAARVVLGEHPHIHQAFEHSLLPANACWKPLQLEGPLLIADTTQTSSEENALEWVRAQL